jgi:hypothetical protein
MISTSTPHPNSPGKKKKKGKKEGVLPQGLSTVAKWQEAINFDISKQTGEIHWLTYRFSSISFTCPYIVPWWEVTTLNTT